jgi:hypothetical protein
MYHNPITITPSTKKPQVKLSVLIWSIVSIVIVASIVAWLIYKNADDNVSLVQYDAEEYSLLVPSTYAQTSGKQDEFTTVHRFVKPNTKTDVKQSQVFVSQTAIPDDFVYDRIISNIEDVYYTEDGVRAGLFNSLDSLERSGVTFASDTTGDIKKYTATGSLSKDNEPYGRFKQTIFVSQDKSFVVLVLAYKTDTVLWNKAGDIIDSFSIK